MTNPENQQPMRPDISNVKTGTELKDWYWLKQELIDFCRANKLPYAGSKQAITDRIAHFLDHGVATKPERRNKSHSKFDWHSEALTPATVITDSYKNTQNVGRFMKEHYGPDFTFNIAFMDWMQSNIGKTLAEAVVARRDITEREKTTKPTIPASNQYNRYTRDFFAANPDRAMREARACWAYKRGIPGHNRYEESDLVALKK